MQWLQHVRIFETMIMIVVNALLQQSVNPGTTQSRIPGSPVIPWSVSIWIWLRLYSSIYQSILLVNTWGIELFRSVVWHQYKNLFVFSGIYVSKYNSCWLSAIILNLYQSRFIRRYCILQVTMFQDTTQSLSLIHEALNYSILYNTVPFVFSGIYVSKYNSL